ncbi:MAG: invasion associated locus B family protein, partial [Caulobacterales bacterium]|uniref:invasion associated locus B family protein n=1 Tax=Glycocaulis sp. TaxID=1969725 RepID=UPI003F9FBCF0
SAFAASAPALAQAPHFQGQHNDWRVFTRGSGPERICYAISRPVDSRPGDVDHGDVYFFVSTWASGAAREQPSFLAGYELRADNPPRASVGSDRVSMYVDDREGFVEEPREESRLVDAMRRGATMRVEAVSARGTNTAYTFSLSGVTAALRQAGELCR